ncbi:hypothetical protein RJ640_009822 [Escallonia rubra]|uniref:Leucine-rich repeat-containing N-terminal plant-type domain-containing protein n=1 Tax=Escallonia rubra TaxID=112253 RepID=A0AA88QNS0_9ASTE|nr:hypothetical protein RJ640_009822 [Escallonia rubra]
MTFPFLNPPFLLISPIITLGFLFILLCRFASSYYACNQIDYDSLLAFSQNISTHPSTPLSWSSPDCCHWEGIACGRNSRVTSLELPLRGLSGSISPSLGNLTYLSRLNLSRNSLSGNLPDALLSHFTRLAILDLSFNKLFNERPLSLPLPFSIRVVDLSSNHFAQMIQTSFLKMASTLMIFNVSNNSFTGQIPSSICTDSPLLMVLDFSFNDFNDQIPQGFGGCSQLEVLRAGFNNLLGLIPSDFYSVTTLREISFPANRLSGPVNASIVQLVNLTILNLASNELIGQLPRDIGMLSNLEQLSLHMNSLTGPLPPSLVNCSKLKILNLRENYLEGDLFALNFSKLELLRILDLGNNFLTGSLPASLYLCNQLQALTSEHHDEQVNQKDLELPLFRKPNNGPNLFSYIRLSGLPPAIYLGNNSLFGGIPATISQLKFVHVLDLSNNNLSGTIPDQISDLTNLETLDLSGNQLSGEIPRSLKNLHFLSSFSVANNDLEGPIPVGGQFDTFPNSAFEGNPGLCGSPLLQRTCPLKTVGKNLKPFKFYKMASNLMIFNVNNNSFTGPIPTSICTISNHTRVLDFSSNDFNDQLPRGFGRCYALEVLRAGFNNLSGLLPYDIYNVTTLREISFPVNRLWGSIGGGVVQLSNLTILNLYGNEMSGLLPRDLGKLSKLEQLLLHSNYLTGSLTPSLMNCRNLITLTLTSEHIALQVNQNYLELPIFVQPTGRTNLAYVRLSHMPPAIYLGNNSLNGDIPTTIGQLKFLHVLDLSNNNFSGIIPYQISYLRNLEKLDLSWNNLSGEIPVSIGSLYFLSSFSVAHNALEGIIPSGTQLQSFPDSSYEGNPGLCGFVLQRNTEELTTFPMSMHSSDTTSDKYRDANLDKFAQLALAVSKHT